MCTFNLRRVDFDIELKLQLAIIISLQIICHSGKVLGGKKAGEIYSAVACMVVKFFFFFLSLLVKKVGERNLQ